VETTKTPLWTDDATIEEESPMQAIMAARALFHNKFDGTVKDTLKSS
jgi:hypothetical protein